MKPSIFKVFPGALHEYNKGCADWGWSNLFAYGCQTYIVIVDPLSLRQVQTLDAHPNPVVRVKWYPRYLTLNTSNPFQLLLVSGDSAGNIYVWDVHQASIIASLTEDKGKGYTQSSLEDMAWHPTKPDILASIHRRSTLILWDIQTKQKLWHSTFKEPIISFKYNPFDPQHMCVATEIGGIYFVRDFTEVIPPRQIDLKYRISSPDSEKNDFQDMVFSPHSRNIMYFVLKRRVLVFDLSIHQAIGSIGIDKNRSSFVQAIPCKQRSHLLFCLHEDGSLTAWHKKENSFGHELQCVLDLGQLSLSSRKQGVSIYSVANGRTPRHEHFLTALRNDGVLYVVRYLERLTGSNNIPSVPLSSDSKRKRTVSWTPGTGIPDFRKLSTSPPRGQTQVSKSVSYDREVSPHIPLSPTINPDIIRSGRFIVVGNLPALASGILCLSSCPTEGYYHIIAVGTQSGLIQILNLKFSSIISEFKSTESLAVRGLRWLDRRRLIYFVIDQCDKSRYKNYICILDSITGKTTFIRKKNEPENTYIRGIRPSNLGKYIVVLLKDQPFQIWDLESNSLLKSIKSFMQITAMAWAPLSYTTGNSVHPNSTKESFLFMTPDGATHFYHIENNVITLGVIQAQLALGIVQAIAWQDNYLVSGDNSGNLQVWNFEKRRGVSYPLPDRCTIRRIIFAPLPISPPKPPPFTRPNRRRVTDPNPSSENSERLSVEFPSTSPRTDEKLTGKNSHVSIPRAHRILVQFTNGTFAIWDLDNNLRISTSAYVQQRNLSAHVLDWASPSQPIMVSSDGALRLIDFKTLSLSNCPIQNHVLKVPVHAPLLFGEKKALVLKAILEYIFLEGVDLESAFEENCRLLNRVEPSLIEALRMTVKKNDEGFLSLPKLEGTRIAERALLIAQYFGSIFEIEFWTLALHVLENKSNIGKSRTGGHGLFTESSSISNFPIVIPSKNIPHENLDEKQDSTKGSIPDYFDLLLDSSRVRQLQLERANIHRERKSLGVDYHLTQKIAEFQLLLGHRSSAVELLLSSTSSTSNPHYYTDALMACIVAATIDQYTFINTVKLVATNLIANDKLDAGVQLLCLIGKGAEACRDLQSYDRWTDAAWLAKIALPPEECSIVMKKWANHLIDTKERHNILQAVCILLTLGQIEGVLDTLLNLSEEFIDVAALFATACIKNNLILPGSSLIITIQKIYASYAATLSNLQYEKAAHYYSSLAQNLQHLPTTTQLSPSASFNKEEMDIVRSDFQQMERTPYNVRKERIKLDTEDGNEEIDVEVDVRGDGEGFEERGPRSSELNKELSEGSHDEIVSDDVDEMLG